MANRTDKYKTKLRVSLSEKEKAGMGQEMADAQQKISELEAAFDQAKSEHKTQVTAQVAIMGEVGGKLRQGYEFRTVECERYFDYENSEVVEKRLDTGEEICRRSMTEQELQMEMELIDGTEGELDSPDEVDTPETTGEITVLEDGEDTVEETGYDEGEEQGEDTGYSIEVQALVDHLRETKRCSTNAVRRALNWGYEKATRIINEAEELGLVGPAKGGQPRDILVDL